MNVTPTSSTEWQSAVKQCQNAELDLQCKLRSDGGEYAAYLESWAAAVTPLDPTDVPEELHQVPSKSFWKGKPAPLLLFSDPHVPDVSDWSPLPAPHTLPPRPAPLGWLSGIVPENRQTAADHTPRVKAGRTRFATDTVLGFGIKMASNVAQRFGTFLVNCMRHIIDLEEQKWIAEKRASIPAFDEWCRRISDLKTFAYKECKIVAQKKFVFWRILPS